MKRIAMLLSAALLATSVALLAPVSPASAHTDACVGQGTATTGAGLLYVGLGSVLTTFTFTFSTGVCATKVGLTAGGEVHGYCGLSNGSGGTTNGHQFEWIGVGSMLVLFLDLTGVVNATPNVLANESCVGGADNFLVTGVTLLTHGL